MNYQGLTGRQILQYVSRYNLCLFVYHSKRDETVFDTLRRFLHADNYHPDDDEREVLLDIINDAREVDGIMTPPSPKRSKCGYQWPSEPKRSIYIKARTQLCRDCPVCDSRKLAPKCVACGNHLWSEPRTKEDRGRVAIHRVDSDGKRYCFNTVFCDQRAARLQEECA